MEARVWRAWTSRTIMQSVRGDFFMAQHTRKGSANRKPSLKIATDAAPAVDSASTAAAAAFHLDSASPAFDAALSDADSASRDIDSGASTTGLDTVSPSNVPSEMW